ncbi:MAG: phage tail protein [Alcaligenaceae bacterium]|nr:phage tail protein [Alcaligenaceae bacterium]
MSTKTAYQYDLAGLYAGTTEADESPLEPGVYLLPDRSTFVTPPANWPEDKWPRFNGHSWKLMNKPILPVQNNDPVEKLRIFLANNPDVKALIEAEQ